MRNAVASSNHKATRCFRRAQAVFLFDLIANWIKISDDDRGDHDDGAHDARDDRGDHGGRVRDPPSCDLCGG